MKWYAFHIKDMPTHHTRTITIYNLGEPNGVFLIKRRDYKRKKVWVIKL
jgi:hypothetical protein